MHRHRTHFEGGYNCDTPEQTSNEDRIESTTFMAGVKKNIISKKFKGGEITNVLGGAELNLSQADFEGTITLEITNVLGGTKLVIPANWEIQSEVVSVMGSIEDKRPIITNVNVEKNKVLVLRGTVFMGGIDITSY
jgi:predicted membrane protein